jgi:hypothetical protein
MKPPRSALPLPRYVRRKPLKGGGWGYFFDLPTWARKTDCPVHSEPLGLDYEAAVKRAETVLLPAFDDWRGGGGKPHPDAPAVAVVGPGAYGAGAAQVAQGARQVRQADHAAGCIGYPETAGGENKRGGFVGMSKSPLVGMSRSAAAKRLKSLERVKGTCRLKANSLKIKQIILRQLCVLYLYFVALKPAFG